MVRFDQNTPLSHGTEDPPIYVYLIYTPLLLLLCRSFSVYRFSLSNLDLIYSFRVSVSHSVPQGHLGVIYAKGVFFMTQHGKYFYKMSIYVKRVFFFFLYILYGKYFYRISYVCDEKFFMTYVR